MQESIRTLPLDLLHIVLYCTAHAHIIIIIGYQSVLLSQLKRLESGRGSLLAALSWLSVR